MSDKVSVKGVGGEWTSLRPNQFPVLFAGGGWQDGQGTIRPDVLGGARASNVEREEDITGQLGMGSRVIDKPEVRADTERLANSNMEFNASQFKSTNQSGDPQGTVAVTTTDDGATADMTLHIDPREEEEADLLLQLAGIHDRVTREAIEHGTADPNVSWKPHVYNPFAQKTMTVTRDAVTGQETMQPGQDYEYDPARPLYTAAQQRAINKQSSATGLRKVNTRKSTGTLFAALETKKDMYDGIKRVQESIFEEMGAYDKSFVKDRDALLAPNTFKGAEYLAAQPGLENISRSQHNKYRKSRHVGQLHSMLVNS